MGNRSWYHTTTTTCPQARRIMPSESSVQQGYRRYTLFMPYNLPTRRLPTSRARIRCTLPNVPPFQPITCASGWNLGDLTVSSLSNSIRPSSPRHSVPSICHGSRGTLMGPRPAHGVPSLVAVPPTIGNGHSQSGRSEVSALTLFPWAMIVTEQILSNKFHTSGPC